MLVRLHVHQWVEDIFHEYTTPTVLERMLTGGELCNAEHLWLAIGEDCGVEPVCLWVSIPCLFSFLYGKHAKVWRLVKQWRAIFERHGIPQEYVGESLSAEKRKLNEFGECPDCE